MNQDRRPVTLEDLLRLKRAERPPAEFWSEFDRELRAKQLAAIVEQRPWWAPVLRGWVKLAYLQLPVGATAILALTFVTVREYRTTRIEDVSAPVFTAPTAVAPVQTATQSDAFAANTAPASAVVAVEQPAAVAVAEATIESTARAVGETSHVTPMFAGMLREELTPAEPTPSARSIAANLAAVQASDPDLVQMLAREPDFGSRRQSARASRIEPLSQIANPGDARRSRLLAGALPVSAGFTSSAKTESDRSHERQASRLDDRLYDSISRLGVRGPSVAIKF